MRRVVLLCLGVVSCASPDVPRVDGVPEDPGFTPPTLPVDMGPEAPVVPNQGDESSEAGRNMDAGTIDVPLPPVAPSTTTTAPTTTPATSSSSGVVISGEETADFETGGEVPSDAPATEPAQGGADAGAAPMPCDSGDAGFDAGTEPADGGQDLDTEHCDEP